MSSAFNMDFIGSRPNLLFADLGLRLFTHSQLSLNRPRLAAAKRSSGVCIATSVPLGNIASNDRKLLIAKPSEEIEK
jgi:hypothetical protein